MRTVAGPPWTVKVRVNGESTGLAPGLRRTGRAGPGGIQMGMRLPCARSRQRYGGNSGAGSGLAGCSRDENRDLHAECHPIAASAPASNIGKHVSLRYESGAHPAGPPGGRDAGPRASAAGGAAAAGRLVERRHERVRSRGNPKVPAPPNRPGLVGSLRPRVRLTRGPRTEAGPRLRAPDGPRHGLTRRTEPTGTEDRPRTDRHQDQRK